jgi:dolichol-phosphate mannosyltransferase
MGGSASVLPRVDGAQVVLVLAAFNEEQNLGPLLTKIHGQSREMGLPFHVVIVDDGSTDRTWEAIEAFRGILPLTAIRHPVNQGLGQSVADGVAAAVKIAGDDDIVVTMDADETHPPGLIPRMFAAIREGRDVVIASRYRPDSYLCGISFRRCVMSYLAAVVSKAMFPIKGVRDYTSGFRAFSGTALRLAYREYGPTFIDQTGFQCTIDILLKMRRLKLVFGEVPLVLRYDLKKGPSKLPAVRTIKATLWLLLRRRIGGGGM